MAASRRERIESMLANDPQDVFLRYSLAMELEKEGENDRSLEFLHGLMSEAPAYVPAFFRSGQQLASLGRISEARAALRDGIEYARQQGDAHAAGEMSEFLAGLGALGE
jgi:predicted Zn-dependent protease